MKKVMTNSEVAAAFVARKQPYARNNHGTFYFEGDCLYSYGKHFVVARWLNGRLLHSRRHHSPSTSAHGSCLRRAVHSAGVIYVSVHDADKTMEQEMEWALNQIATARKEALNRVNRPKNAARHIRFLDWWEGDGIRGVAKETRLPVPSLPPWPDALVALKAECQFRSYL